MTINIQQIEIDYQIQRFDNSTFTNAMNCIHRIQSRIQEHDEKLTKLVMEVFKTEHIQINQKFIDSHKDFVESIVNKYRTEEYMKEKASLEVYVVEIAWLMSEKWNPYHEEKMEKREAIAGEFVYVEYKQTRGYFGGIAYAVFKCKGKTFDNCWYWGDVIKYFNYYNYSLDMNVYRVIPKERLTLIPEWEYNWNGRKYDLRCF